MKVYALFIALSLVGGTVQADLIERSFAQAGTGKVASGYVLQGSRGMKNLGKRSRTVLSSSTSLVMSGENVMISVPSVNTVLNPPVSNPKPRFGYGSDYRPKGSGGSQPVSPPVVEEASPEPSPEWVAPVVEVEPTYTFQHFYYPHEYWPAWRCSPRVYSYGPRYYGSFYGRSSCFSYARPNLFFRFCW